MNDNHKKYAGNPNNPIVLEAISSGKRSSRIEKEVGLLGMAEEAIPVVATMITIKFLEGTCFFLP